MVVAGISPKFLSLIKAYYASTKKKIRASESDSLSFEIRSDVQRGCAFSPTLFNYVIDLILNRAFQGYPGVQVGTKVHASDLA